MCVPIWVNPIVAVAEGGRRSSRRRISGRCNPSPRNGCPRHERVLTAEFLRACSSVALGTGQAHVPIKPANTSTTKAHHNDHHRPPCAPATGSRPGSHISSDTWYVLTKTGLMARGWKTLTPLQSPLRLLKYNNCSMNGIYFSSFTTTLVHYTVRYGRRAFCSTRVTASASLGLGLPCGAIFD